MAAAKKPHQRSKLVKLGLVDASPEPGRPVDPRKKDAVAFLLTLARDHDLDLRLVARRSKKYPPGEADAAWLDTWEQLDLEEQVRALDILARCGPDRTVGGQRILERHAHAAAVEADLRAWVAARGGDPSEVEVFYYPEKGTYDVINGQTCLELEHLDNYGIDAAFERMRDIVSDE